MFNMSSSLNLLTTGFINSVHSPFGVFCCMSYNYGPEPLHRMPRPDG